MSNRYDKNLSAKYAHTRTAKSSKFCERIGEISCKMLRVAVVYIQRVEFKTNLEWNVTEMQG